MMLENGAMEISPGDSRLRTETAAVAVTYFSAVNSFKFRRSFLKEELTPSL